MAHVPVCHFPSHFSLKSTASPGPDSSIRIGNDGASPVFCKTQIFLSAMLMQIFFSGRQAAPDMSFGFVHIKHLPGLSCKARIDMQKAVCYILMYRTLTDSKFLRCLPHCRIVFNDIIRYIYRSFFDIILQGFPP